MDKKISVILPVYNGGIYLSEAIKSILNQTFPYFELIIINDGSKDYSCEVIQKYADTDERIIFIDRENQGLIRTLNEGLEISQCKYIARMDQDDISIINRLQLQYEYMKKNDLDICGGDYVVIDKNSHIVNSYKVFQSNFEILLTLASNVPFPHSGVMINKDFLSYKNLKYGINGNKQAEDLDLWLNMYNNGAKFGNVGETILKYRILETSMSRINHKKIMKEKNQQIDHFVKENELDFKEAFTQFLAQEKNSYAFQRVAFKAALRYALIHSDMSLLCKCMKKIRFRNLLLGFGAFIKLTLNG